MVYNKESMGDSNHQDDNHELLEHLTGVLSRIFSEEYNKVVGWPREIIKLDYYGLALEAKNLKQYVESLLDRFPELDPLCLVICKAQKPVKLFLYYFEDKTIFRTLKMGAPDLEKLRLTWPTRSRRKNFEEYINNSCHRVLGIRSNSSVFVEQSLLDEVVKVFREYREHGDLLLYYLQVVRLIAGSFEDRLYYLPETAFYNRVMEFYQPYSQMDIESLRSLIADLQPDFRFAVGYVNYEDRWGLGYKAISHQGELSLEPIDSELTRNLPYQKLMEGASYLKDKTSSNAAVVFNMQFVYRLLSTSGIPFELPNKLQELTWQRLWEISDSLQKEFGYAPMPPFFKLLEYPFRKLLQGKVFPDADKVPENKILFLVQLFDHKPQEHLCFYLDGFVITQFEINQFDFAQRINLRLPRDKALEKIRQWCQRQVPDRYIFAVGMDKKLLQDYINLWMQGMDFGNLARFAARNITGGLKHKVLISPTTKETRVLHLLNPFALIQRLIDQFKKQ